MPTNDPSGAATIRHASQRDSTHGPAAEASAARVIALLRSLYSDINTGDLTSVSACAESFNIAKASQRSLIGYIQSNISGIINTDKVLLLSNKNIAATINLIDLINKTSISFEKKQKIFKQMRSIAMFY